MYIIKSKSLSATFSDFGTRLLALEVDGIDVAFGTSLNEAEREIWDPYAGATLGRHAGRITGSKFTLDGVTYPVVANRDGFQLHGGPKGFGNSVWQAKQSDSEIEFSLLSPDGDQGFPGELHTKATFGAKENILWAELTATTSKPTIINLTNHAYWNLVGPTAGKNSGLAQEVMINASNTLVTDQNLLPTGELASVKDTRFDFRKPRAIAESYDDCYSLDGTRGVMKHAASLRDPVSGRRMEMWTTECAMQFYTAVHWNNTFPGKGRPMEQFQAIALEAQNMPDAPNHPNFPSSVLRPGAQYRNRIEWRFT